MATLSDEAIDTQVAFIIAPRWSSIFIKFLPNKCQFQSAPVDQKKFNSTTGGFYFIQNLPVPESRVKTGRCNIVYPNSQHHLPFCANIRMAQISLVSSSFLCDW